MNTTKRLVISLTVDLPRRTRKMPSEEVLQQRVLLAIEAFRQTLIESGVPAERVDARVHWSPSMTEILHGEIKPIEP